MKHMHFYVESDGFYGAYWACKAARIDIDRRMTRVICDWRDKK